MTGGSIAELAALGWRIEVLDLGEGFPRPTAGARAAACAQLVALLRPDRPIVVDGLAFGVLPEAAEMLRESHRLVALVHHPLALESGLSASRIRRLARERTRGARLRPPCHRNQRGDRAAACCPTTAFRPSAERGRAGHRSASRTRCARSSDGDGRAAGGRRGGPAQGLRCAGRRAGRARGFALAARHRRRRRAKPGDAHAARGRYCAPRARRPHHAARRGEPRSSSRRFTHPPICSCCPRASKATAWPMPRLSPMACRWSARPPAPFLKRCRPTPACWCRRTTSTALAAALRRLIENPRERERLAAGARAARFPSWSEQAALLRPRAGSLEASRMSGFSAEWLALREPYDLAARNATVLDAVAGAFAGSRSIAVVDLACGTGATLRAVGGASSAAPELAAGRQRSQSAGAGFGAGTSAASRRHRRPVDLVRDLELALDGRSISSPPRRCSISSRPNGSIASSSKRRRGGCRSTLRSAMTAARVIEPGRPFDDEILAASTCISAPTRASVRRSVRPRRHARWSASSISAIAVVQGRSDWVMGPDDRDIQDALFAGWAELAALTTALSAEARSRNGSPQRRAYLARRALAVCASVTSTSSPGRSARAERRDRSRAARRRRSTCARIGARIASLDPLDRRQREARSPAAEDDRGDQDMQPVEAAGGEEARDRVGAAFDQNAAEAALGERGDDRRRG